MNSLGNVVVFLPFGALRVWSVCRRRRGSNGVRARSWKTQHEESSNGVVTVDVKGWRTRLNSLGIHYPADAKGAATNLAI